MSAAVQTLLAPPFPLMKEFVPESPPTEESLREETLNRWPSDILEAYRRSRGPYTVENAETILEEEPVELFNGWLVWQEMTDLIERSKVANPQEMLSLYARNIGFGQAIPDQAECLLSDGDVVKPDVSLLSWHRLQHDIHYSGRRKRPLLNGGPDLVIEVRSPSNRRAQEKSKRTLYFQNKVKIIWDVDHVSQTIWVYHAETPDTPIRYDKNDIITCESLLPGWKRRVADIFANQISAKMIAGEIAETWRAEEFIAGKSEGFAEGESAGAAKHCENSCRWLPNRTSKLVCLSIHPPNWPNVISLSSINGNLLSRPAKRLSSGWHCCPINYLMVRPSRSLRQAQ